MDHLKKILSKSFESEWVNPANGNPSRKQVILTEDALQIILDEMNVPIAKANQILFDACFYTLNQMSGNLNVVKDDALFSCLSHLMRALSTAHKEGFKWPSN